MTNVVFYGNFSRSSKEAHSAFENIFTRLSVLFFFMLKQVKYETIQYKSDARALPLFPFLKLDIHTCIYYIIYSSYLYTFIAVTKN